jgi:hypothetical protein
MAQEDNHNAHTDRVYAAHFGKAEPWRASMLSINPSSSRDSRYLPETIPLNPDNDNFLVT